MAVVNLVIAATVGELSGSRRRTFIDTLGRRANLGTHKGRILL